MEASKKLSCEEVVAQGDAGATTLRWWLRKDDSGASFAVAPAWVPIGDLDSAGEAVAELRGGGCGGSEVRLKRFDAGSAFHSRSGRGAMSAGLGCRRTTVHSFVVVAQKGRLEALVLRPKSSAAGKSLRRRRRLRGEAAEILASRDWDSD